MSLGDFLEAGRFEDFYESPDIVLVALGFLFFILVYSFLKKTPFGKKNSVILLVISSVISLIAIFYLQRSDLYYWLLGMNSLLILVSIAVVSFIFWAFYKFFRSQY